MEATKWDELELVIFDVDGTLYDQSKLRRNLCFKLFRYYALNPWKYREILVLYHFRKEREKRIGYSSDNLSEEQYLWCKAKVDLPIQKIKDVIDYWMFKVPNQYLKECRYPGLIQFVELLDQLGILVAVYSDYPAQMKLKALGLKIETVVSSTDKFINALKPAPAGINYIIEKSGVNNKLNCLYIGDRDELDGQCARNASVSFLLIEKEAARAGFYEKLYHHLSQVTIKR